MYKIDKNIENTIIIKNSKFITNLFVINSLEDINNYLELIKKKYKDATHHCYGYIYGDITKCSDDNEPSGTAGIPILNILKNNNINYILCIVTRYFGGTLLGAGGLIRAYAKSASNALQKASLIELTKGYNITLIFPYSSEKLINKIINKCNIISKKYTHNITLIMECPEETLLQLNNSNISYTINKELLINKSYK